MPGKAPSLAIESLWQTPQAWTRTSASPRPGKGTSRSTSSKSPPCSPTCIALIVAIAVLSVDISEAEATQAD